MTEIKLIDSLTPAQEAEFPRFRKKWMKIGESTKPINKEKAREAVLRCYDLAWEKLAQPDSVIFVESPFQLFYARPIWNRLADALDKFKGFSEIYSDDYTGAETYNRALWYQQGSVLDDKTSEREEWLWGLRFRAMDVIFGEIVRETEESVAHNWFKDDVYAYRRALALVQQEWLARYKPFFEKRYKPFFEKLVEEAKSERGSEIYGQNETWLCFYEFMEWAGCEGLESTHGLRELANHAGWWIPYENVAVVSDRPEELHLDDEGRLHSHDRPAIAFRDGWKFYASHGMEIPYWIIEYPERLTSDAIDNESNVEVRRVMLEIYGLDNYLENGKGCKLVDADPDPHVGSLYVREQANDEDIFMLKMRNSTQELDGSWKTYVIRVPPTMTTAKQANAWSYGFENPEDYSPVRQS
jgi:hypothetical protein